MANFPERIKPTLQLEEVKLLKSSTATFDEFASVLSKIPKIAKIDDVRTSMSPKIGECHLKNIKKAIVLKLDLALPYFGVTEPSKEEKEVFATMVIESYPNLRYGEFSVLLNMAMQGAFGQIYHDKITIPNLFHWVRNYYTKSRELIAFAQERELQTLKRLEKEQAQIAPPEFVKDLIEKNKKKDAKNAVQKNKQKSNDWRLKQQRFKKDREDLVKMLQDKIKQDESNGTLICSSCGEPKTGDEININFETMKAICIECKEKKN